jgi:hypothetical protein
VCVLACVFVCVCARVRVCVGGEYGYGYGCVVVYVQGTLLLGGWQWVRGRK